MLLKTTPLSEIKKEDWFEVEQAGELLNELRGALRYFVGCEEKKCVLWISLKPNEISGCIFYLTGNIFLFGQNLFHFFCMIVVDFVAFFRKYKVKEVDSLILGPDC